MLKKVITIKNVGKFRNCHAAGDVEFRPHTLIYAENSRGKTTLCDVLRSSQTGNGEYIKGRHTLSSTEEVFVELLFDDGVAKHASGTWNVVHPEIEIYDTTFVHANVYAGDYVDHDHKKNLYRVIVGEEGVKLAREVDDLDEIIRNADRTISQKKNLVEQQIPEGVLLESFLTLSPLEDIDARIEKAQRNVSAYERANEIKNRSSLTPLTLPDLPLNFSELLSRKIGDISSQAEKLVHQHIEKETTGASESWVSEGLGYILADTCPFCGQSVTASELLETYKTYFGESYNQLKSDVDSLQAEVEAMASDATLLRLEQTLSNNQALLEFWAGFISVKPLKLNFDTVRESLQELATQASALVQMKLDALLEAVDLGPYFTEAQSRADVARKLVASYNRQVTATNTLIESKKDDTEAGDGGEAKKQLNHLIAVKQRHDESGQKACKEYKEAMAQKKALQEKKSEAKKTLDDYSASILRKFESRINQLLRMFGAGFQIGSTTRQYRGGHPSSVYQVVIDEIAVDLGDAKTDVGTPSFRNTLSAGDRSTLALAFFIAQVELDPDLATKILVFDDPFSSQDRSRSTCTQQIICRLAGKVDQVVVLSHEPKFLRRVWDCVEKAKVRALQLTRIGDESTINPWDIEDETRGEYLQKLLTLKAFVEEGSGDSRHVAQTIRPVLEEYLRFNWPWTFSDSEWLGGFLAKIREAQNGDPLYALVGELPNLEDINDFSKRYHHAQNPGADSEPIDNTELVSFAKRTLSIVSAC